jgi:hypothetical protein
VVRAPGERTVLTAPCGGTDEPRCMLPWPSSAFAVTDVTTSTGLRVSVEDSTVPRPDNPAALSRADGFSRITPIMTGFTAHVDPATAIDGVVRVINSEPGPGFGSEFALGLRLVNGVNKGVNEAILIITPKRPLAAASEQLVVVMDSIRGDSGQAFTPSRTTLVALALAPPANDAEQAVFAHFAPARAMVAKKQIDPARVLKLWDFTTRSTLDPTKRLLVMRQVTEAAANAGTIGVVIDSKGHGDANIATVVLGRLTRVPNFLTRQDFQGELVYDANGAPVQQGVQDVQFRIAMPRTTRDYPVVIWGHGTGGDYTDDAFDEGFTGGGLAKVGFNYLGWTGDSIIQTIGGLIRTIEGADRSTAHLMQAHANIAALEALLPGKLGDALSVALTQAVPGTPPVHPNMGQLIFAGGSLGGTMGLVHVAVDRARIHSGLLNVPGTGWTQFVPLSVLVNYARPAWSSVSGGDLDLELQIGSSQIAWDDVDGANWIDAVPGPMPICLLQESIGDPVLPNIGNELVAQAMGAVQVGVPLRALPGMPDVAEAINQTGLQQYRAICAPGDVYCVHGFAGDSGLAGQAARQQIGTFLLTSLLGISRIATPPLCLQDVPDGSCDFYRGGY